MHTTALILLLVTTPAEPPPVSLTIDTQVSSEYVDPATACVEKRLKPFMSPYGIRQAWPVMVSPPPEFLQVLGPSLSDTGHIADGYQQFLRVDPQARAVYVIQQGGFAGTTKVYGPLPLPRCTPAVETPEAPRR